MPYGGETGYGFGERNNRNYGLYVAVGKGCDHTQNSVWSYEGACAVVNQHCAVAVGIMCEQAYGIMHRFAAGGTAGNCLSD